MNMVCIVVRLYVNDAAAEQQLPQTRCVVRTHPEALTCGAWGRATERSRVPCPVSRSRGGSATQRARGLSSTPAGWLGVSSRGAVHSPCSLVCAERKCAAQTHAASQPAQRGLEGPCHQGVGGGGTGATAMYIGAAVCGQQPGDGLARTLRERSVTRAGATPVLSNINRAALLTGEFDGKTSAVPASLQR